MNRIMPPLVLALTALLLLLSSCGTEDRSGLKDPAFAVESGYFVGVHGTLRSDPEMLDTFLESAEAGRNAAINILQYTVEGDPVITHLEYCDGRYCGTVDYSLDRYSGRGIENFSYDAGALRILTEENADGTVMVRVVLGDTETAGMMELICFSEKTPEDDLSSSARSIRS